MINSCWTSVVAIAFLASTSQALDNGLGLVPQMGWNTWNKFGCNIQEDLIKDSVD
jgi:alpha-galactosidase